MTPSQDGVKDLPHQQSVPSWLLTINSTIVAIDGSAPRSVAYAFAQKKTRQDFASQRVSYLSRTESYFIKLSRTF